MKINELEEYLQKNPQEFFSDFGGLHDSEVLEVRIDHVNKKLAMKIDDLYANFFGLPEYKELNEVMLSIEYNGQYDFHLDQVEDNILLIYDVEFENGLIKVSFSPSGYFKCEYKNFNLEMTI
jgi:hypothetical protein